MIRRPSENTTRHGDRWGHRQARDVGAQINLAVPAKGSILVAPQIGTMAAVTISMATIRTNGHAAGTSEGTIGRGSRKKIEIGAIGMRGNMVKDHGHKDTNSRNKGVNGTGMANRSQISLRGRARGMID